MRTPTFFLLFAAILALSASAFQQQRTSFGLSRSATNAWGSQPIQNNSRNPYGVSLESAHFASESEIETTSVSVPRMVRNKLRQATGFSFTVFRATLRGITGISLSALYAGALAATGLWIRKAMSTVLSVFPSGFRYFLQPFLVLYYTPLILLRSLTSPKTRKRAVAKHETVLEAWKEAVAVADKTEKDGYWPVVVDEEGYFELTKPPSVDGILSSSSDTDVAEAMAQTVELAMELKSDLQDDEKDAKK